MTLLSHDKERSLSLLTAVLTILALPSGMTV